MILNYLPFVAALLCSGLAAFVYLRNTRSFTHRAFAVGMIALALEEALAGLGIGAILPEAVVRWQRLRLVVTAALPGSWLLFSLSFARANYRETVAKWRWVILAAFVVPFALAVVFGDTLFLDGPFVDASADWVLRLGWSGYAFHLVFLLSLTLILMNLERTLRASAGGARWQIKFMILGLGGFFAVQVYTVSQVLLFSRVETGLEAVNAGALIVATGLIIVSLHRARLLPVDLYLSQTFLYNSIAVLTVGTYLLAVGVLAKAVSFVGDTSNVQLGAFLVFLALLGLTIVLLSNQLREQVKRFISRHLSRPRYDYRNVWGAFTQRTASVVDVKDLGAAVAKMVSETFGVPSVTIWLWDEARGHFALSGSTVLSLAHERGLKPPGNPRADLIRAMRDQPVPVDCDRSEAGWAGGLKRANTDVFREAQIRYCVPLVAGQEVVGILALNEKLTKELFSVEDFDLLKTIADQAAGSLLNLKRAERLLQAKEMETFQALSAFFVHDLKNVASTLSMTMRNMPAHFEDPAFRHDALRAISQSVARMDSMCDRLSLVGQAPELDRIEANLNELVTTTLATLSSSLKVSPIPDLRPVPGVFMDPDQTEKVLTNLILNANDAVGNGGEIRVATREQDGWVVLSVSDNGCGMSKAFVERSLFLPFHTTKKQGLGIGLFQSKRIVEAHGGWIEVESEDGKGSTFQVVLPVGNAR